MAAAPRSALQKLLAGEGALEEGALKHLLPSTNPGPWHMGCLGSPSGPWLPLLLCGLAGASPLVGHHQVTVGLSCSCGEIPELPVWCQRASTQRA